MPDWQRVPLYYPTWFLKPATPLECCLQVKAAGFDGASFLVGMVRDPRRLDLLSEAEADELRGALIELGLGRSLHVWTPSYIDEGRDFDAAVALLKEHVRAAVKALTGPGLPALSVTLDPPVHWVVGQPWLPAATAEDLVRFLASLSDEHDVRPGLENWPFAPVATPEALMRILSVGDGKVGLLFDAGHAHVALNQGWCAQEDVAAYVEALGVPIVEMHLHDNHGQRDEHLMPGDGTADLQGALDAAFETGFRGPVTWPPRAAPGCLPAWPASGWTTGSDARIELGQRVPLLMEGGLQVKWVTRSHVHVDRVACPWLIKRFVDSEAQFLFVPRSEVQEAAKREDATPFDAPGVELGHHGEKCSFDAIIDKYQLTDKALLRLAGIVRAADTGRFESDPVAAGLEAIASGYGLRFPNDQENLARQFEVYDALYAWCSLRVARER